MKRKQIERLRIIRGNANKEIAILKRQLQRLAFQSDMTQRRIEMCEFTTEIITEKLDEEDEL